MTYEMEIKRACDLRIRRTIFLTLKNERKVQKMGVLADIKEGRAAAADGEILYSLSVVFEI